MNAVLRFTREDVAKMDFRALDRDTALRELLCTALRGGGLSPRAAEAAADGWLAQKGRRKRPARWNAPPGTP